MRIKEERKREYIGGGDRSHAPPAECAGLPKSDRFSRELLGVVRDVAAAAVQFERRWTFGALARLHSDLADRLARQRELWAQSVADQDEEKILARGRGLVRGYNACFLAMETCGEPDDSYWIGACRRTGFRVAIGPTKASADRVREVFDGKVPHYTPDEVAALLEGLRAVNRAMAAFPGAEIVAVRSREID